MIENRVRKILQIEYEKRILVYDRDGFAANCDYVSLLRSCGFSVYLYDDIERIRHPPRFPGSYLVGRKALSANEGINTERTLHRYRVD